MNFSDEPQARSIFRAPAARIVLERNALPVPDSKSLCTTHQLATVNTIEESDPDIKVGDYTCDLIKEYERSKGHCFLVLEDCDIGQLDESVELFLIAAKEKEKIISFHQKEAHCWNCKLSCGQVLIRTAQLEAEMSIVQVHRCSGCGYGTHRLRQKIFQYLKASHQHTEQRSAPLLFVESVRRVPFDFLECTTQMRQVFQDRCSSLLGSDQSDRRELAKQALLDQHPL